MKKLIQIHYFQNLILISLFVLGLLFGGNNAFAVSKSAYEVIAKKADGAMTTTFHVYAVSEYEAKEEVALNGWEIISVSLMKKRTDSDRSVSMGMSQSPSTENSGMSKKNSSQSTPPKNTIDYDKRQYLLVTYFDFALETTTLDNDTLSSMKQLNRDSTYIIYGHTDSVPVKRDNQRYRNNHDLSIKRARFIKGEMVRLADIPEENIKIVGMGERFPAMSDTETGQPKNRRVEVYESQL